MKAIKLSFSLFMGRGAHQTNIALKKHDKKYIPNHKLLIITSPTQRINTTASTPKRQLSSGTSTLGIAN